MIPRVPSVQEAMRMADAMLDCWLEWNPWNKSNGEWRNIEFTIHIHVHHQDMCSLMYFFHCTHCTYHNLFFVVYIAFCEEKLGTNKPDFDKDPGWKGLEENWLLKRPKQSVIKGWLKAKRESAQPKKFKTVQKNKLIVQRWKKSQLNDAPWNRGFDNIQKAKELSKGTKGTSKVSMQNIRPLKVFSKVKVSKAPKKPMKQLEISNFFGRPGLLCVSHTHCCWKT